MLVAQGDGRSAASTASASSTVEISLTEFAISGNLTVPAGRVVLNVTNKGTVEHNLDVRVDRRDHQEPRGRQRPRRSTLGDLKPGSYEMRLHDRRAQGLGHEGHADGHRAGSDRGGDADAPRRSTR